MPLRSGAEIIMFLEIINKASGAYGILALFTGAGLSPLQFSMYLWSLLVLIAATTLYRHIRAASALYCVLLAHLYTIDSAVNAVYTAVFGVAWFYVLALHPADDTPAAPGAAGIQNAAGFTTPEFNVSAVEVVAEPAGGLQAGQDAVAVGTVASDGGAAAGLRPVLFQSGSAMSLALIAAFWAVRVYFIVVLLAFARQALRQHIMAAGAASATAGWYDSSGNSTSAAASAPAPTSGSPASNSTNFADNPFAADKEAGAGWKGYAGRALLRLAPRYWLGPDDDGEWMRGLDRKFRRSIDALAGHQRARAAAPQRDWADGSPGPPRCRGALNIAKLLDFLRAGCIALESFEGSFVGLVIFCDWIAHSSTKWLSLSRTTRSL